MGRNCQMPILLSEAPPSAYVHKISIACFAPNVYSGVRAVLYSQDSAWSWRFPDMGKRCCDPLTGFVLFSAALKVCLMPVDGNLYSAGLVKLCRCVCDEVMSLCQV